MWLCVVAKTEKKIALALALSHLYPCVYDVVDDYKKRKKSKREKIIKRHKSRAATAPARTL